MNGTIIIVDDSLTVRMDLIEAFTAAGLRAIGCETAAAAREALGRYAVGLMVLDVLLPDGNGVDLLREIRSLPGGDIPVLMLSTEADVQNRIRGLMTGSDDYVGKPYDRDYVVARARELLGRKPGSSPPKATVLVIDDSTTFREELCAALRDQGYHVLGAASGEEGLRSAATHRPAAVVVDGVLPGIDGATVVRKLRLDAALRQTACVLLTGSTADLSAELNALDAGADAFVRKEEDLDIVLARVAAALRSAGAAEADRETASLLGPKKILAVDDSLTYLDELTTILRGEGYDVISARSGEEALEMLSVQPVDCILLDLLMPGLSGIETCRRIKASPATRDIPLVMLTANEDREAMIEGLSTGADDYVLKSNEDEVLKARVRAQLRRKQTEDESRRIRLQLLRKELEAAEARAASELAKTRAALVGELQEKNRELELAAEQARRAEERFRALAETASDAILAADAKGVIAYANPTAERLFGYPLAELVGQPLTLIMPERFRDAHCNGMQRYVDGGEPRVIGKGVVELAGLRNDGMEFPLELTISQWSAQGQLNFTAIIRDISARREAEGEIQRLHRDVQERAAALAAANKELEAFSYSVSHDLRAPLRAIDGFSRILLDDHGTVLDATGRDYLERVRRATQHMGQLIDDMLLLSRVTRTDPVREPVDLGALAQEIAAGLRDREPERQVHFEVASQLKANGDSRLLRIALENLIGNAWKFTGARPEARIEFGTRVDDGGQVYFVRDNGAGFDMTYVDKLFAPFQRLHTNREFPGTGIGLATVQRVVSKHGGRVWAEGATDQGATFYFTLK